MTTAPTSVPASDADPRSRVDAIHRDRETYRFDHSWEGLTFPHPDDMMRAFRRTWFGRPAAWPHLSEQSSVLLGIGPKWMAHSAPLLGRTVVNNRLAATMRNANARPVSGGARRTRRTRAWLARAEHFALRQHSPDPTPAPYDQRTPSPLRDFHGSFTLVDEPLAARYWNEDWWFAQERLAGCNPVNIELVTDRAILERIPLTPARFASVCADDSLERALAEHRLYAVDFSILDGLEAGVSFGWQKFLYAPIALLALSPDRSELRPVAIQCGQVPSPSTPVITPADGMAWTLAKVTFAAAESNYHGIAEHGAFCHIMIGALAVALRRSLAPWHPVRVLLEPNIEYTIAVSLATKNLFEPGGRTPNLQAVTPGSCAELVRRAWKSFDWTAQSGSRHFERRGVDDAAAFPGYTMRDDITPLDSAIRSFVDRYVALYYGDDAAVIADVELQAWHRELISPAGADQPSAPALDSVATLSRFLADIIWRASPYHAVINYSILDAMGFVPNMPTATYAPAPVLDPPTPYSHADLLSMLPPIENCDGILEDVVHVSGLRLNRLGHYRRGHFDDARVAPLVSDFQAALRTAGDALDERNRNRRAPYEILHPDRVTASIHI